MTKHYFLGIDGGGTSCRARLTDANLNIIGEAVTGSANLFQNPDGTLASIIKVTSDVIEGTGIAMNQIHAGIGLAGAGIKSCQKVLAEWQHPFKSFSFATDAKIACIGAHNGDSGAILIIGTGICGWVESPEKSINFSGWGFPIADQGSGAWLGFRAIQETLNAVDGIVAETKLTQKIIKHFNDQPDAISHWSKQASSADFGGFAPWVVDAANDEDAVGLQIMNEQTQFVEKLLQSIQSQNTSKRLALMGGLSSIVENKLSLSVQNSLSKPFSDALNGALLMIKSSVDDNKNG